MAQKAKRRGLFTLIAAPPLMAALMATFWSSEFVRELENVTIDRRFRARADTDPLPDPRIALIGIGDHSLKMAGRWEEWTRSIHGAFADALGARPPKILAFDLFFSETSRDPSHDEAFAFALELHPGAITGMRIDETTARITSDPTPPPYLQGTRPITNVIGDTSTMLHGTRANAPIKSLAEVAWTGFVNCPASKSDGMRRVIPLVGMVQDTIYPSLVLQILMQLEETSSEEVEVIMGESIKVPKLDGGLWEIPIDETGAMAINYRNTALLEITDYVATMGELGGYERTGIWPGGYPTLIDQIVIIGQSAEGLQDLGPTPYSPRDPLFRIQATALNNILQGDFISHAPKGLSIGIWLLVAWLTLFLLRKAPVTLDMIVPFLVVAAYGTVSFYIFEQKSLILPFVLPVAGFILIHTITISDRLIVELQEKRYIKGVFGSYVSPEVVDQIVDSGELPELGGEEVDISILFSDIQGFSTFSEQLSPVELVDLMVEYLSAMTEIITEDGGTLDKYIGDAIDAMYGAPLPLDDHAYLAVVSTIRMQNKQAELRKKWTAENRKQLIRHMRTRIGLNTGPAVVGNMGSVTRFNYTMMGDSVNLAARCESGAKSFGVYTMITDETRKAAEASHEDVFYRYLDQIVVQGRTLPVKVHEVIGFRNDQTQKTRDCIELYTNGFGHYLKMEWGKALDCFEKSSPLELHQPERDAGVKTNPSRIMIDRCSYMKSSPPAPDWDGVYQMISK